MKQSSLEQSHLCDLRGQPTGGQSEITGNTIDNLNFDFFITDLNCTNSPTLQQCVLCRRFGLCTDIIILSKSVQCCHGFLRNGAEFDNYFNISQSFNKTIFVYVCLCVYIYINNCIYLYIYTLLYIFGFCQLLLVLNLHFT